MALKSKNVRNKGLAAGLAVATGFGMAQSAEAAPNKAPCNVSKAIERISKKVVTEQDFRHQALVAKRKDASVKVFEKGNEHEALGDPYIENPLAVKCGSKVVRYVGVSMSKDGIGDAHRVDTLSPYKLYVHSIAPKDAVVQVESPNFVSLDVPQDAQIVDRNVHYGLQAVGRSYNGIVAPGFTNGKSDFGKVL